MDENKETTPKTTKNVPTLGYDSDGIMGSTTTEKNVTQKSSVDTVEVAINKVAIFSTRNMYAEGAGKINVGYNIVPKKYADFWLVQRGVRLATPEEVAEAFA